jgi:hypothetical protein
VLPVSEPPLLNVEGLNDARTLLGERCVLAHRGWVGENRDFFSILFEGWLWNTKKERRRGRFKLEAV